MRSARLSIHDDVGPGEPAGWPHKNAGSLRSRRIEYWVGLLGGHPTPVAIPGETADPGKCSAGEPGYNRGVRRARWRNFAARRKFQSGAEFYFLLIVRQSGGLPQEGTVSAV